MAMLSTFVALQRSLIPHANAAVFVVAIRHTAIPAVNRCTLQPTTIQLQGHLADSEHISHNAHTPTPKCIDMLRSQQHVIQRSLNALDGWKESNAQCRVPNDSMMDDLKQFSVFFKEYAEGIHFAMEEQMVFPLIRQYMNNTLIPYHEGIFLPSDHDTARRYLKDDVIDQDAESTLLEVSEFITTLRVHCQHSMDYLYPSIQRRVPVNVMQDVSSLCHEFMQKHQRKEVELLRICEELERKYGRSNNRNSNARLHSNNGQYLVDFELL